MFDILESTQTLLEIKVNKLAPKITHSISGIKSF